MGKEFGIPFGLYHFTLERKKGDELAVCSWALLYILSWKDWLSTAGGSAVLEKGSNNFLLYPVVILWRGAAQDQGVFPVSKVTMETFLLIFNHKAYIRNFLLLLNI